MKSISVLTSTMNRADYLERVYLSLLNQNFVDFEWIVGDDGSTDSTITVLKKLKKNAPFDIKIVSASVRIGKTTIDNKMIEMSEGKYIKEIPIETFYGTERSSVHLIYALRFFLIDTKKIVFFEFIINFNRSFFKSLDFNMSAI